jgi:hypothetical protein
MWGRAERPAGRDLAGAALISELGGFSWGSAFFGWLVATGLSVLLIALAIAIASVAGTRLARDDLGAIGDAGLAAGLILLVILMLSYFAGGYVAGRLARFNGTRAGFGVWAIAGALSILLGLLGGLLGSQFNLLAQVELPRISLGGGTLALGGVGALVISSLATLVTSLLGGRLGERYHNRLDRRIG